ncbi:MAG: hypothetical protein ABH865_01415 [Candidatus Omnitrophota bacterium]|nr:hypothetical protein [Candidatus Omnitrophota bacterium]
MWLNTLKFIRRVRGQSILEYVCVCAAFAMVGIATFLAMSRASVLSYRGMPANYTGNDTLVGKTIRDPKNRISEEVKLQTVYDGDAAVNNTWGTPNADISGRTPSNLVADSETHQSSWNDASEDGYVRNEDWRNDPYGPPLEEEAS